MFFMVWRTILLRIQPTTLIVFTPNEVQPDQPRGNIISRCLKSFKDEGGAFRAADKGRWETAETEDETSDREANWFRIGFEPLFADFTQSGTWFVVIFLVQVGAVASRTSTHCTSTIKVVSTPLLQMRKHVLMLMHTYIYILYIYSLSLYLLSYDCVLLHAKGGSSLLCMVGLFVVVVEDWSFTIGFCVFLRQPFST